MKDTRKEASSTSKGMKELKGAIAEVAAAFATFYGVKVFISNMLDADAVVARLADNLGMSANELNAWGNAIKTVGGNVQDAQGMLSNMSMSITQMQLTGDTGMLRYLRALGVELVDAEGKALPASQVILNIADKLHAMSRTREGRTQAYNLAKMMGFDDSQINLMMQGRQAMQSLISQQEKLNTLTPAQAEAAKKSQADWAQVSTSYEGVGRVIATTMLPVLETLAGRLQAGSKWLKEHKDVAVTAFYSIATVITAAAVPAIVALVAAWGSFVAATLPISGIIIALVALGWGIYQAWKSYRRWVGGEKNDYWEQWAGWLKTATEWWTKMTDAIGGATAALGKWYDKYLKKPVEKVVGVAKKVGSAVYDWGMEGLKNLIGRGEGDYDSVNLGQKGGYKAAKRNLEGMTINEVLAAQERKEFNAAGRYQMIPGTLNSAKSSMGLSGNEKFDKAMQDKIFTQYLLMTKRKDLRDYLSGKTDNIKAAGIALSQEWASVADPRTGKSYYAGQGNNRSTINPQEAAAILQSARQQQINNSNKSSHVETHVGQITVHTASRDGAGIGRDIRRDIQSNGIINQADYGLA
jgi:hypothetical protein